MWTLSIAVTHKKVMFVINTYVLALSMPETVVIVAADKLVGIQDGLLVYFMLL